MTGDFKIYRKTRIAPTPSGFLHLGNVFSFAVTGALAHQHGAKIVLRIDDMDQARVNQHYVQDIFDTLEFFGIPWDEGPRNVQEFTNQYSQLHRMGAYRQALTTLRNNGRVFACTCSRKQIANNSNCSCVEHHIPLDTPNASWRLITGANPPLQVKNYPGQIIRATLPQEMHNFIVRKKDGFPAYQLTSLVDDLFYHTDLVVRGHDLWASTIAQHQLAMALGEEGFKAITFYHHPLLTGADGNKLSKSAGATSVRFLRESGKSPAQIYMMLAQMAGINQSITNWQQLGEALLSQ